MNDFELLDEWEDPDENDGEWPYPTTYKKSRITGDLAERIKAAFLRENPDLGVEGSEVIITEEVVSSGYSEYTQENEYNMVIQYAGYAKEFTSGSYSAMDGYFNGSNSYNNLGKLLKWTESPS
jgi:hypothetical protein